MFISFLKKVLTRKKRSKHPNGMSRRFFLGAVAGGAIALSQLSPAKAITPPPALEQKVSRCSQSCIFCGKNTINPKSYPAFVRCEECFCTAIYRG